MRQMVLGTVLICIALMTAALTPPAVAARLEPAGTNARATLVYRQSTVPATEIEVTGTHLLVLANGWLQVFEIGNPAAPRFVGQTDLGNARGLRVQGNYAYVDGIRILYISPFTAPYEIGAIDLGDTASVAGNYAYVLGRASPFEHRLSVVNLTDPTTPHVVGTYTGAGDMITGHTATTQRVYLLPRMGAHGFSGIETVDVTNPALPHQQTLFDAGAGYPQDIDIAGQYAYIAQTHEWTGTADVGGGIYRMNAADPEEMVPLPQSGHIEEASAVEAANGVAAVLATSGEATGIRFFDIEPAGAAHELAHYAGPDLANATDIALQGNYVYAALGSEGWAVYCFGGALEGGDIGFRPCPDGYAFKNWSDQPDPYEGEVSTAQVRALYGDIVCVTGSDPCLLRADVQAWVASTVLQQMHRDGHCLGIAVTAARFFTGRDHPSRFDPAASYPRELVQTMPLRQEIGLYHMMQHNEEIQTFLRFKTGSDMREVREQIQVLLNQGEPVVLVLVTTPGSNRSHAVNAFSLKAVSPGIWQVEIYDNGSMPPYTTPEWRTLVLDEYRNSWSVVGGGGEHTGPVIPIPLARFVAPQTCPSEACTADGAVGPASVRLEGDGHVLITGSSGDQIGYIGDTFVNTMPGGFAIPVLAGLERDVEPTYEVPLTDTYTIALSGSPSAPASVHLAGQVGTFSIETLDVAPHGQAVAYFAPDAGTLGIETDTAQSVSIGYVTGTRMRSSRLQLGDVDVEAGAPVTFEATPDTLKYQTGDQDSTYSVFVERRDGEGIARFRHAAIPIAAHETHHLYYHTWQSGGLTVDIDVASDGTIDRRITLSNEYSGLFLPQVGRH
jgi:hypothetical protein